MLQHTHTRHTPNNLKILPRDEALTFARFFHNNEWITLLVDKVEEGMVFGLEVDRQALSLCDAIDHFAQKGYEHFLDASQKLTTLPLIDIEVPFHAAQHHIAVGINYPEHGKEVSLKKSFLFPKFVQPSKAFAKVPQKQYLLDYELELGFVLLKSQQRANAFPQHLGFVLALDYTDRAQLLREMNLFNITSGHGFTSAKSHEGFMPLGSFLVIPKDHVSFLHKLQLKLWVNDELRQDFSPTNMIWGLEKILHEAFLTQQQTWTHAKRQVQMPIQQNTLNAKTIFLTGTGSGVIFHPPSQDMLLRGLWNSLKKMKLTNPNHIFEYFIEEANRSQRFLQSGDTIQVKSDYLGVMQSQVI